MKINSDFFRTISKERYLKYIRSLPNFRDAKVQTYATLILTLFAICFFGIFAIGPTISTITELRKTLEDNKYLDSQLNEKITNMTQLQTSYLTISSQLALLQRAIPSIPDTTRLTGQLRTLAQRNSVTLTQLQTEGIDLANQTQPQKGLRPLRVAITVQGTPDNLEEFTDDLLSFERLIVVESLSLVIPGDSALERYRLVIQAKAYYKQ